MDFTFQSFVFVTNMAGARSERVVPTLTPASFTASSKTISSSKKPAAGSEPVRRAKAKVSLSGSTGEVLSVGIDLPPRSTDESTLTSRPSFSVLVCVHADVYSVSSVLTSSMSVASGANFGSRFRG